MEGKLNVKAKPGIITPEIQDIIRNNKQKIIDFIESPSGKSEIRRAEPKTHYPLSLAQSRLYFLHEFDKSSIAYNMPQVTKIQGELDIEKLRYAFNQLIERHESLRTSIEILEDLPFQKINDQINFQLELFEASESDVTSII